MPQAHSVERAVGDQAHSGRGRGNQTAEGELVRSGAAFPRRDRLLVLPLTDYRGSFGYDEDPTGSLVPKAAMSGVTLPSASRVATGLNTAPVRITATGRVGSMCLMNPV